jgi:hypothetical protein
VHQAQVCRASDQKERPWQAEGKSQNVGLEGVGTRKKRKGKFDDASGRNLHTLNPEPGSAAPVLQRTC